jgi:hypothetical protein
VILSNIVVKAGTVDVLHFFEKAASCRVYDLAFLRHRRRNSESKGVCYVEFSNDEDVLKAVALNGTKFVFANGHVGLPCSVERCKHQAAPEPRSPNSGSTSSNPATGIEKQMRTVILKNVDPSVDDTDLKKIFASIGTIISIKMQNESNSGEILFGAPKEAETAVKQLNGLPLCGKPLTLSLAGGMDGSDEFYHRPRNQKKGAKTKGEDGVSSAMDWNLEDKNYGRTGGYKLTAARRTQMMKNMMKDEQ